MTNIHWENLSDSIEWQDIPNTSEEDLYEILEVSPRASPEVISRAYRVLAVRYHPDKYPEDRRTWAEQIMKRINHAHQTLSNEQSRIAYDRSRTNRS